MTYEACSYLVIGDMTRAPLMPTMPYAWVMDERTAAAMSAFEAASQMPVSKPHSHRKPSFLARHVFPRLSRLAGAVALSAACIFTDFSF